MKSHRRSPPPQHGCTCQRGRDREAHGDEDTRGRLSPAGPREESQDKVNLVTPCSWTSSLSKTEKTRTSAV